ncbi:MAG: class I SAM-dependent methyltransferase, partial [Chrysiogenales bacterium]
MILQTIKQLMTAGDKCAQFKALQMMKPVGRLIFYNGAIDSGLLELLTTPSTFEQIADTLNIKNRPLLSSLLDLGCVLDELSCKKNHYHIKGAMAKAMTRDTPIADLMRETVHYHADVALRMNSYLKKNKKGDYLKDLGGVIAGSSRIGEPLIKSFINHTIKKSTPLTILECGCGSGEYLKYYVDINRKNSGIAIDKDASAVKIARQSIKKNNIETNFTVLHDDIAIPRKIKGASFDLVTS